MAISTNQKPTIYRNLYENTDPVLLTCFIVQGQVDIRGFCLQIFLIYVAHLFDDHRGILIKIKFGANYGHLSYIVINTLTLANEALWSTHHFLTN